MDKKSILGLVALIIFLIIGFLTSLPDDRLHLIFCDVGQGDAILATLGDKQVLIDGGPNSSVVKCLSENLPFWDREIELVILTHAEADHLTGLVPVTERYIVKQIVSNGIPSESGVFSQFRDKVVKNKIPVYLPQKGDKIKLGKLEFEILWPEDKQGNSLVWQSSDPLTVLGVSSQTGLNDSAIAAKLDFGEFETLLMSDLGEEEESHFPGFEEQIEVLKVGHHGSKTSTSKSFIEDLKPALAVISVGASNKYGHPSSVILDRLNEFGIDYLRTDLDGEIEVISDGQQWQLAK